MALESAVDSTPIVLVDTSSTALPSGQAQLAIDLRITGVATSGSLTAHEAALVAATVDAMLLQVRRFNISPPRFSSIFVHLPHQMSPPASKREIERG